MKNIIALLITLITLTATNASAQTRGLQTKATLSTINIATCSISTIDAFRDSVACSVELPDMITDFSGVRSNDYVVLSWAIQNPTDATPFIVEKSNDGNNWQAYTSIPTHGITNTPAVYFYGDAHPAAINYYRLKQTLDNGAVVYTDAVKVAGAAKKTRKAK